MKYQVDSDLVSQATATVRSTIANIESDVDALLNQLTSLQSSWTGNAASAFQAVISDWRQTQHRVEESLENINQALARAGEHYREAERVNTDLFRVG
ncbi:hypothetical protein GCM10027416_09360 [Okibacterium endophyticum]